MRYNFFCEAGNEAVSQRSFITPARCIFTLNSVGSLADLLDDVPVFDVRCGIPHLLHTLLHVSDVDEVLVLVLINVKFG